MPLDRDAVSNIRYCPGHESSFAPELSQELQVGRPLHPRKNPFTTLSHQQFLEAKSRDSRSLWSYRIPSMNYCMTMGKTLSRQNEITRVSLSFNEFIRQNDGNVQSDIYTSIPVVWATARVGLCLGLPRAFHHCTLITSTSLIWWVFCKPIKQNDFGDLTLPTDVPSTTLFSLFAYQPQVERVSSRYFFQMAATFESTDQRAKLTNQRKGDWKTSKRENDQMNSFWRITSPHNGTIVTQGTIWVSMMPIALRIADDPRRRDYSWCRHPDWPEWQSAHWELSTRYTYTR